VDVAGGIIVTVITAVMAADGAVLGNELRSSVLCCAFLLSPATTSVYSEMNESAPVLCANAGMCSRTAVRSLHTNSQSMLVFNASRNKMVTHAKKRHVPLTRRVQRIALSQHDTRG
jgi:hypothetical protein